MRKNTAITDDPYPSLQSALRRLGFQLGCEEVMGLRRRDHGKRKSEHRRMLNKLHRLLKVGWITNDSVSNKKPSDCWVFLCSERFRNPLIIKELRRSARVSRWYRRLYETFCWLVILMCIIRGKRNCTQTFFFACGLRSFCHTCIYESKGDKSKKNDFSSQVLPNEKAKQSSPS